MQLVINIPEDVRIAITRVGLLRIPDEMQKTVDKAIQSGKPIPKGHGDLKDADALNDYFWDNRSKLFQYKDCVSAIDQVDTIIEADKEEREGNYDLD